MEQILLVSASEKNRSLLRELLSGQETRFIVTQSGAEARRWLAESSPDIIVIDAPLPDEFGNELAVAAAESSEAGIMLLVRAEISDAVAEKVEDEGVMVVSKPLSRVWFHQALRLVRASRRRMCGLQNENERLKKKVEEIRLIDRAKCILIECRGMTEPDAHAYLEKRAMDTRRTLVAVATDILAYGDG